MTLLDENPNAVATRRVSAATLEVDYLHPILQSLPADCRSALDVGAHKGDFTEALADLGLKVLAVEPQDYMAERFATRHADRISGGLVRLARCAVSDRAGYADLLIGSASSVSTLEPAWTTVAFPEEFRSSRSVRVPTVPLSDLAADHEFGAIGFAKVDVEGHEAPALRGLFRAGIAPPMVVMFEANQRFPQQALDCLSILRANGYRTFDIIIRIGLDPIAAERFTGEMLPACWHSCGERYFYANVIAYHPSLARDIARIDPVRFVQDYQMNAARDLLATALQNEAQNPVPVHPVWNAARLRLRDYLLSQPWHDFLRNPVCKEMFVRGRWTMAQDFELAAIEADPFAGELIERLQDPAVGLPRCSEKRPGVSTNLLGMIWYILRVHQQNGDALPRRVIEVGGGYGALAYAYARCSADTEYVIVDLPEMLAIQHYFLTLALPDRPVVFADAPGKIEPRPGEITLVPVSRLEEAKLNCRQLISTFAVSEMPRELQRRIERLDYFGAKRLFVTGQLSTEFPGMDLVSHGEVVGAAMAKFPRLRVERFHVGDNYTMLGERD